MKTAGLLMLSFLLLLPLTIPATAGTTKIVPTDGAEPGEPFTIIDTPDGRLVDGSVAVFKLSGSERTVPLRTHKPFNTAQRRLPTDMGGGLYDVFVRQPSGTEFPVGTFLVIAPVLGEPFIEPICEFVVSVDLLRTLFTIADPKGRMQQGDTAIFYPEGSDPTLGHLADNVSISADGTTLTGLVPLNVAEGVQNFVSVRPTLYESSRFGDLPFYVTADVGFACIYPSSGPAGTVFTIFDPQGRMVGASIILFTSTFGSGQVAAATGATFTADGKSATGAGPSGIAPGPHLVTVHLGPGTGSLIANDLRFFVTLGPSDPFIYPTSAPVGTRFTIFDPQRRLFTPTRIFFSPPGVAPGDPGSVEALDVSFARQVLGDVAAGTVPLSLLPGLHLVTVHGFVWGC